ncbi:MAG: RNA methyltransferase, partial [uncultured bacterium]
MFFKKPKADNMRVDEPEKTEEKIYSFQKIFARQNPGILKTSEVEPLSNLDYKKELNLKNEAFREFLNANKIHAEKIDDILPSPKPRQYRTTTKRKVILQKGKFVLNFNESAKYISNDGVAFSNLEPEEHLNIYKFIIKQINETNLKITARHLNYIIIRGNYREFSVIFNVDKLHAKIIKSLKDFSGRIKDANLKVMSSFIFVDPLKSDYYFESSTPDIPLRFKKLFGPDKLFKEFKGKKFSLHPTSFSQVNESVVPLMIEKIRKMLSNCHFERLVDLYCGYGLFSVFLNDSFDEVIGIDSAKLSIESA